MGATGGHGRAIVAGGSSTGSETLGLVLRFLAGRPVRLRELAPLLEKAIEEADKNDPNWRPRYKDTPTAYAVLIGGAPFAVFDGEDALLAAADFLGADTVVTISSYGVSKPLALLLARAAREAGINGPERLLAAAPRLLGQATAREILSLAYRALYASGDIDNQGVIRDTLCGRGEERILHCEAIYGREVFKTLRALGLLDIRKILDVGAGNDIQVNPDFIRLELHSKTAPAYPVLTINYPVLTMEVRAPLAGIPASITIKYDGETAWLQTVVAEVEGCCLSNERTEVHINTWNTARVPVREAGEAISQILRALGELTARARRAGAKLTVKEVLAELPSIHAYLSGSVESRARANMGPASVESIASVELRGEGLLGGAPLWRVVPSNSLANVRVSLQVAGQRFSVVPPVVARFSHVDWVRSRDTREPIATSSYIFVPYASDLSKLWQVPLAVVDAEPESLSVALGGIARATRDYSLSLLKGIAWEARRAVGGGRMSPLVDDAVSTAWDLVVGSAGVDSKLTFMRDHEDFERRFAFSLTLRGALTGAAASAIIATGFLAGAGTLPERPPTAARDAAKAALYTLASLTDGQD